MRWLDEVRGLVNGRLAAFFESKRAARVAPEALVLIDAVADLTLRGGKRFRPALLAAAHRSVASSGSESLVDVGAALELLQTYLLIHDDWMDDDAERRGGPAVHVAFRQMLGGDAHRGAALAILAGNLASAYAWELLVSGVQPEARDEAFALFLEIHQEVAIGEQLDLTGADDVSLIRRLKTGSYSVRGPLLLGATLGGASRAQREALVALASPLGEAFQMRDDLLGTFGDPTQTGKPIGGDLRAGTRTALIHAAEASGHDLEALRVALGKEDASDAEIARAKEVLVDSGARAAVEDQLAEHLEAAKEALVGAPLRPEGTEWLRQLADGLALRDR